MKPQLAVPFRGSLEELKQKGYAIEPKLDGVRAIVSRDSDGVRVASRTGQDLTGKFPHIIASFEEIDAPQRFAVDGEIVIVDGEERFRDGWFPLASFQKLAAVVQSNDVRAVQIQERHKAEFFAFDVLEWGKDLTRLPDFIRRDILESSILSARLLRDASSYVKVIPRWIEWTTQDVEGFVEGEGFILKNRDAPYQKGKRPSKTWVKYKFTETQDAVIMGFKPGTGSFTDVVGSIRFGQYKEGQLVERGYCSGMDFSLRMKMTQDPDAYIGRVIEVRNFGGSGETGYRHPQFIRLRDDKAEKDCVWV